MIGTWYFPGDTNKDRASVTDNEIQQIVDEVNSILVEPISLKDS